KGRPWKLISRIARTAMPRYRRRTFRDPSKCGGSTRKSANVRIERYLKERWIGASKCCWNNIKMLMSWRKLSFKEIRNWTSKRTELFSKMSLKFISILRRKSFIRLPSGRSLKIRREMKKSDVRERLSIRTYLLRFL